jgi:hypothetical protein
LPQGRLFTKFLERPESTHDDHEDVLLQVVRIGRTHQPTEIPTQRRLDAAEERAARLWAQTDSVAIEARVLVISIELPWRISASMRASRKSFYC